MSSPPNVSFEIQVLTDKNWVVAEFASDEAKAKAFADNLLQKGNHSAVRVVRDRRGADGLHKETIIQEKTAIPRSTGPDVRCRQCPRRRSAVTLAISMISMRA